MREREKKESRLGSKLAPRESDKPSLSVVQWTRSCQSKAKCRSVDDGIGPTQEERLSREKMHKERERTNYRWWPGDILTGLA